MCGIVACLRSISGSFISIGVGIRDWMSLQFHACNDGVISAQKEDICDGSGQTQPEPVAPPTGGNIRHYSCVLLESAALSTQAVQRLISGDECYAATLPANK